MTVDVSNYYSEKELRERLRRLRGPLRPMSDREKNLRADRREETRVARANLARANRKFKKKTIQRDLKGVETPG